MCCGSPPYFYRFFESNRQMENGEKFIFVGCSDKTFHMASLTFKETHYQSDRLEMGLEFRSPYSANFFHIAKDTPDHREVSARSGAEAG